MEQAKPMKLNEKIGVMIVIGVAAAILLSFVLTIFDTLYSIHSYTWKKLKIHNAEVNDIMEQKTAYLMRTMEAQDGRLVDAINDLDARKNGN